MSHVLRDTTEGERMHFIAWIVLGLISGFIASKLVNKTGEGFFLRYPPRDCRRPRWWLALSYVWSGGRDWLKPLQYAGRGHWRGRRLGHLACPPARHVRHDRGFHHSNAFVGEWAIHLLPTRLAG